MAGDRSAPRPLAVTNAALRVGVRVMPWIPPWLKRLLAGGRRITIDGNTLDPTLQLMLAAQRGTGTGGLSASGDPEVARALMRSSHAVMASEIEVSAEDITVPGPESPLRTRYYRPDVDGIAPLLVFFHGGGFVVGDLESHDGLCRMICRDAAIHVLSVDYRLAPEHKAPAAVDDCFAAYRWALGHAAELGADPARIGVGGDSAGGNLAALVALHSRDEGIAQPVLQVLLYPVVDLAEGTRSRKLFSDGFFLSKRDRDWFTDLYLGAASSAPTMREYRRCEPPISPAWRRPWCSRRDSIPCVTRATPTPRRCARPASRWTIGSSTRSRTGSPASPPSAAAAPTRWSPPSRRSGRTSAEVDADL